MKTFELPKMEIAMFDENSIIKASGQIIDHDLELEKGPGNAAGKDILSDTVSTYSIGYNAIDMSR